MAKITVEVGNGEANVEVSGDDARQNRVAMQYRKNGPGMIARSKLAFEEEAAKLLASDEAETHEMEYALDRLDTAVTDILFAQED
jgi:hypothetical protein